MDALAVVNPNALSVDAGSRNAATVYLASLSSGSQDAMRRALTVIAEIAAPGIAFDVLPWGALRYEHTQAIRARLADQYDAATANKTLSALRQTLKAAWRLEQMTADEYMRAADVANIKGEKPEQAAGRALSHGELLALVAACNDGSASGIRDAAILAVAYAGGLRRAEIVALDFADVDVSTGVLRVKGKRNKVRTVPLWNGALLALQDWMNVRGDMAGAMFWRIRKGDALVQERMTTQAVYFILRDRADKAGVKEFSPHDMRRTFAGDMLDAGVDISTVQKLMGHASVSTTAGYDRRGERAKQDAAKKLHFPYQGGR